MSHHRPSIACLQKTLRLAHRRIKVGRFYCHVAMPTKHYRVERLAVNESDYSITVVYSDGDVTWTRSLDSWLSGVNGRARFSLIE